MSDPSPTPAPPAGPRRGSVGGRARRASTSSSSGRRNSVLRGSTPVQPRPPSPLRSDDGSPARSRARSQGQSSTGRRPSLRRTLLPGGGGDGPERRGSLFGGTRRGSVLDAQFLQTRRMSAVEPTAGRRGSLMPGRPGSRWTSVKSNLQSLAQDEGMDRRRWSLLRMGVREKLHVDKIKQWLTDVLNVPSEDRSEDDIEFIVECTKANKFLQTLSKEVHKDLCKVMYHRQVVPGEAVFYQGEIGRAFFILLEGTVQVYVKASEEEEHAISSQGSDAGGGDDDDGDDGGGDGDGLNVVIADDAAETDAAAADKPAAPAAAAAGRDLGRMVAVLGKGDSFGELALLKSGVRNASIIANSTADLLCLNSTDYGKTLKRMQQSSLQGKLDFLHSIDLFRYWRRDTLAKLSYFMERVTHTSPRVVLRQGVVSEDVYIIFKGECRLVYDLDELSDRQPMPEDGPALRTIPSMSEWVTTQRRKVRLDVAQLLPGQIFGETGVVGGKKERFTVLSTSGTELLVVHKDDFLRRVDERTMGNVRRCLEMKEQWLSDRMDHIRRVTHEKSYGPFSPRLPLWSSSDRRQLLAAPYGLEAAALAESHAADPDRPDEPAQHGTRRALPAEVVEMIERPPLPKPKLDRARIERLAQARNPRPPCRSRRRLLELLNEETLSTERQARLLVAKKKKKVRIRRKNKKPKRTLATHHHLAQTAPVQLATLAADGGSLLPVVVA